MPSVKFTIPRARALRYNPIARSAAMHDRDETATIALMGFVLKN
jgi:hypothetical protein